MPTPASRAIARIDGSVPADTNRRVATSRSWSRLRAASARNTRVPGSAKTDHAPVMVRCLLQPEHSPLLVTFIRRQRRHVSMQQPGASTAAATSRAVQLESFGGPEVLNLREVSAPQAGPGQIRVRVTAAGLNPMDWFMTSDAQTATRFGLSLPSRSEEHTSEPQSHVNLVCR